MDVEMHEAAPTPTLRSAITVPRSAALPVAAPCSAAPRTATAPAAAPRNVTPCPAAAPMAPPRAELPQKSPSEMQSEYAAAAAPASRASAWVLPQLLGAIPRNEGMRLPHQVATMRQTASHRMFGRPMIETPVPRNHGRRRPHDSSTAKSRRPPVQQGHRTWNHPGARYRAAAVTHSRHQPTQRPRRATAISNVVDTLQQLLG
ncbi:PREDICTED: translation initiation factor IF-2-like [Rhagoletis zephyria]|uniref:translation initiation factor IF-2-like n=1 Tax=Rhagoletis zephyria TaxID=28612 RepID=UPI0008116297|nr:PREDICTED: translation initiation factor IF-2-like [Rhagoletis zephyria]